ncbi:MULTISPECIES: hypothetical protein [Micromonospora]|nr:MULTISPECIES: hypothetical protein [Micromonospora]RUL94554.1 hypothetical protein EG812_02380 [Verrucosispora sp. FIM060022]WSK41487.1 hypothetical protein OG712_23655 [Micromonospora maris]
MLRPSVTGPQRITALLAGLLVTAIGLTTAAVPASAATVYNRFERTCTIGNQNCSKFVQTNPPYRSAFGSDCVTKRVFGADSKYHLPAGQKCTP